MGNCASHKSKYIIYQSFHILGVSNSWTNVSYPHHRSILAAGVLGHSSVTDNTVSSTTQTMSNQPLHVSPAPGTSLIHEQTLSSTLSSLSHTSLKGVSENPKKERFSRVFSRGVGKDNDKEEQDRAKTAKCMERKEARKKLNSVSCGGSVDAGETTVNGIYSLCHTVETPDKSPQLVPPSQDRQGFLSRLFHRECVAKQEKNRVREVGLSPIVRLRMVTVS